MLTDFSIMEEAGGVGKGITKDFKNVTVEGSTLEIHLYWAGKGTTAIPDRGVYGPLISAITVTPSKLSCILCLPPSFSTSFSHDYIPSLPVDFDVSSGLSAGAIAGIVIASVAAVVLILIALRLTGYLGGKSKEDEGENNHMRCLSNIVFLCYSPFTKLGTACV